jgi:hypothetical protein
MRLALPYLTHSIEFSFKNGLKVRYSFHRDVIMDGSKYEGSHKFLGLSFNPATK